MGLVILLAAALGLIVAAGTIGLIYTMTHPQRLTYAWVMANGCPYEPAQLGLHADDILVRFKDGTQSPGWIIGGDNPDGCVIVMTHGWSSSRYTCLSKAAMLARFASRVVVYDMRGHGDSTAPISRLGTTEADDLLEVLDQLLGHTDRPIVLHGSSMGAGISIVAGARHGNEHIAGVITVGPYRHGMEPIIGHLKSKNIPPYPFVWLACWHVGFWLGGFRRFDRAGHAARLNCPLLVMHGTQDRICKLHSARQIAEAAPQGELIEFDGGGHGGLEIYDQQRYLDAVERFLKKIV